jgi:PBP1b-binding outer membrane lipoprotein LpoB
MILCLVCLAAVGMFCVAGCTTTPPKTNATATTAPTMNNTILKINNNQAPNLSANATTAATTAPAANTTKPGNVTIPIVNATLPKVNVSNLTNVTLPNLNLTK